jgi:hypothetical protein
MAALRPRQVTRRIGADIEVGPRVTLGSVRV